MTDKKRRQFEAANFFKLGYSYVQRDFLDKAEHAFKKTVNADPEHALAWAYISKIHEKNGRLEEAEKCRKKALDLDDKIDFKKIGDECRLLEDRQSITKVMTQYQDGEIPTDEFMDFTMNLSARARALISNNPASKDFFRSVVDKAAMEKTLAFEFQDLPSFLGSINLRYLRILAVIQMNFIRILLTIERIDEFIQFMSFIKSRIKETDEELTRGNGLDLWMELSRNLKETTETTRDPYERALSLFNIIEKQKLTGEDKARAEDILHELVTYIVTTSAIEKKGSRKLVSNLKSPKARILDVFEPAIVSSYLSLEKGASVIELVKSLHKDLTKSKSAKKHIDRVGEWLRILDLLKKAMEKSLHKHSRIVNLLDVIEDTNGEFQPLVIAEQSLKMIEQDLVQVARKGYESYLEMRVLHWELFDIKRIDKRAVRHWLSAIKRAYYKLHHMKLNRDLKIDGATRKRFGEIAERMLRFLILSRKEDLIERLTNTKMYRFSAADVFIPEEYLSFPIPAFRVMTDFLKDPYFIATEVELKNPRAKFNTGFWSFSLAVTLIGLPASLLADIEYVDYIIPEYLKVLSLAVKANLLILRGLHSLDNIQVTPQDVMVDIFKRVIEHPAVNLTESQIKEALEFGEWELSYYDEIMREDNLCLNCGSTIPSGERVCTNCNKPIKSIDLSHLTINDVDMFI